MAKIAGICFIKADDVQFEVEGGVECPMNTYMREPVEALDNQAGHYSEKRIIPYIKLTALLPPEFDREKISNRVDLTITAELANSWVYTLTKAYLMGPAAISGDEGKVELNFSGQEGIWKSS